MILFLLIYLLFYHFLSSKFEDIDIFNFRRKTFCYVDKVENVCMYNFDGKLLRVNIQATLPTKKYLID